MHQKASEFIKIVLLEDEDLLRGLLSEWLLSQPDIEMLESFQSISSFITAGTDSVSQANVIIVDSVLQNGDVMEAVFKALEDSKFKQGLVVLSSTPTQDLYDCLSSRLNGGWALLLKNSSNLASLRQAIFAVRSGLVTIDQNLVTLFNEKAQKGTLTKQERLIMEQVSRGNSNAKIAFDLSVSEKTIERVLSSIYSKYEIDGNSKVLNPRVRATLIFRGFIN